MKRCTWVIAFTLFIISCGQNVSNNTVAEDSLTDKPVNVATQQDTITTEKDKPAQSITKTWADSLISDYIYHSNNTLIRLLVKDSTTFEWMFDQTVTTDTAKYFTYQLGHEESDDNKQNLRFVTDQWIYIDSATRKLYEYDVANDTLTLWKK